MTELLDAAERVLGSGLEDWVFEAVVALADRGAAYDPGVLWNVNGKPLFREIEPADAVRVSYVLALAAYEQGRHEITEHFVPALLSLAQPTAPILRLAAAAGLTDQTSLGKLLDFLDVENRRPAPDGLRRLSDSGPVNLPRSPSIEILPDDLMRRIDLQGVETFFLGLVDFLPERQRGPLWGNLAYLFFLANDETRVALYESELRRTDRAAFARYLEKKRDSLISRVAVSGAERSSEAFVRAEIRAAATLYMRE